MEELRAILSEYEDYCKLISYDFFFHRAFSRLRMLLGREGTGLAHSQTDKTTRGFISPSSNLETVKLGGDIVPRIFMGLWQFSSSAWGTASRSMIHNDFRKHVDAGLIAYGKYAVSDFQLSNTKRPCHADFRNSRYGRPLWRCRSNICRSSCSHYVEND